MLFGFKRTVLILLEAVECNVNQVLVQKQVLTLIIGENDHEGLDQRISEMDLNKLFIILINHIYTNGFIFGIIFSIFVHCCLLSHDSVDFGSGKDIDSPILIQWVRYLLLVSCGSQGFDASKLLLENRFLSDLRFFSLGLLLLLSLSLLTEYFRLLGDQGFVGSWTRLQSSL